MKRARRVDWAYNNLPTITVSTILQVLFEGVAKEPPHCFCHAVALSRFEGEMQPPHPLSFQWIGLN